MTITRGPNMKFRRRCSAALLVASVWLLSSSAIAAAPPEVTEEAANQAFVEGRYEDAIALFEQLYEETGDPNYLYNVGRIHEDDGQLEKAYADYERLVSSRGVDLDLRTQTAERMERLKKIIDATQRDEGGDIPDVGDTPTEAERTASDTPSTTPASGDDAQDAKGADAATAGIGSDKERRRKPTKMAIAGYSLLGVGVGSIIAGASVAVLALRDDQQLSEQPSDPAGVRDDGRTKAWVADGLFIAGGVITATGLTLVVVDLIKHRQSSRRAQRNWHLDGGAGMVGIGISGRI